MEEVSLESLKCGGVVIAVTDTLICNNLDGDEMMSLSCTVSLDRISGENVAVGNEYGQGAEVVEMVVDCRNAERSHGSDDHRAVEGTDVHQRLGKPSVIVEPLEQRNYAAEDGTRDFCEHACNVVKVAILFKSLFNGLLELLIYVVDVISGVYLYLDTGIGRLK